MVFLLYDFEFNHEEPRVKDLFCEPRDKTSVIVMVAFPLTVLGCLQKAEDMIFQAIDGGRIAQKT